MPVSTPNFTPRSPEVFGREWGDVRPLPVGDVNLCSHVTLKQKNPTLFPKGSGLSFCNALEYMELGVRCSALNEGQYAIAVA
jgi:hypothetical protein